MSSQHLSDEAIAAFADGVLSGHARDRASRHAAACRECAHAVGVQREAVLALRAAPAPSMPSGLLERLRSVPSTTPINVSPTAIGPDGSAMFAAFGTMTAAALVPPRPTERPSRSTEAPSRPAEVRAHRVRPIVMTAAAVAAAGVVAVGSAAHAAGGPSGPGQPAPVAPAGFIQQNGGVPAVDTINLDRLTAR